MTEYRFKIDVFTPETLPMKRLAEYLDDLAQIFGHEAEVHFKEIERGSAVAVVSVDEPAAPHVAYRVREVGRGAGPDEARRAFSAIDGRLQKDGAIGTILDAGGAEIVSFPGRNRTRPIEYGPISQQTTLDGQLCSLTGRDETKHAILVDGETNWTGLSTKDIELARRLREHLWGGTLRLFGRGRFFRSETGTWELKGFTIEDFEVLDDRSFAQAIEDLRRIPGGLSEIGAAYRGALSDRSEDGSKS